MLKNSKAEPGYKIRIREGPVYSPLFFTISIYHRDSEPEILSYIHLHSPNTVKPGTGT